MVFRANFVKANSYTVEMHRRWAGSEVFQMSFLTKTVWLEMIDCMYSYMIGQLAVALTAIVTFWKPETWVIAWHSFHTGKDRN